MRELEKRYCPECYRELTYDYIDDEYFCVNGGHLYAEKASQPSRFNEIYLQKCMAEKERLERMKNEPKLKRIIRKVKDWFDS